MIDGVRSGGAAGRGIKHDKKTQHLVAKRKKARDTEQEAEVFAKILADALLVGGAHE